MLVNDLLNTPKVRQQILEHMKKAPTRLASETVLNLRKWASLLYKPPIVEQHIQSAFWRGGGREVTKPCLRVFSERLMASDILIWESDIYMQAIEGGDALIDQPFQMRWFQGKKPQMWIWREEDVEHSPSFLRGLEVVTDSQILFSGWFPLRVGAISSIVFYHIYSDHMNAVRADRTISSPQIRFFPAFDEVPTYYAVADMIAAFCFLDTSAARTSREEIPHRLQKELNRQYHNKPPRITSVCLRKLAPTPPKVEVVTAEAPTEAREQGEHKDVQWQGSWTVREHIRKQWYPSEKTHREIVIREYEKNVQAQPITRILNARR